MIDEYIHVRGARQNNLKNVSLNIPRAKWISVTGVSGSGKSSLAFDVLYGEGRRRYLESLAVHGTVLPRPDVDLVEGLPPTLAIGQGLSLLKGNQTVGTVTEIHDLLAVLFAHIGQQHSPTTGEKLTRYTPAEALDYLLKTYAEGDLLQILAPLDPTEEAIDPLVNRLKKMGFSRLRVDSEEIEISDGASVPQPKESLLIVVDRLLMQEGIRGRLGESLSLAYQLGNGRAIVQEGRAGPLKTLAEFYYCDATGESFPPLVPSDFNFQSPRGRCPNCLGEGCESCLGTGLKPQARACRLHGSSLPELERLTLSELTQQLLSWNFLGREGQVASELLPRIQSRLTLLRELGLDYLTLDRRGNTLSVGETQRVQLSAQVGARLAGVAFIMDEPSRGLHPVDVKRLLSLFRTLQGMGNTLIVVEHDGALISASDHIIELGPGAGQHGGQVVFQGSFDEIKNSSTATGRWLAGKLAQPLLDPRKPKGWIEASGVSCHNVHDLHVKLPLGTLVGFCGVSGSGKSTVVMDVLAGWLQSEERTRFLSGDFHLIERIVIVDQRAAGVNRRSILATYAGLMDPLRELLAKTTLARARGYSPAYFSLNRKGGRCEVCEGQGQMRISLAPLPDIIAPCEVCGGRRYHYEALQVTWQGHSAADLLEMNVTEAAKLFHAHPQLAPRLKILSEVGLDYLTIGQPLASLSGGEAQRLKLAAELVQPSRPTLFLLDEPSAGLHALDVAKLLHILDRLVDEGHSVWLIEHRLEILERTDWLFELGPGAGPDGGRLLYSGIPAKLIGQTTPTGQALAALARP